MRYFKPKKHHSKKPQIRVEITAWAHYNDLLLCGTDTADIVTISLSDAKLNELINHTEMIDAIRPLIDYDKESGHFFFKEKFILKYEYY